MFICLLKDGTYEIQQEERKVRKIQNVDKVMIYTGTSIKGNTFTIVNYSNLFKVDKLSVKSTMSYCDWHDYAIEEHDGKIKYDKELTTQSEIYNAYVFFTYIEGLNAFFSDYSYSDSGIFINSLLVDSKNMNTSFYGEDEEYYGGYEEKYIKNTFGKHGVKSCTNAFIPDKNYLILYKNKWRISKNIPSKFDYIGIRIDGITEDMYLFTYQEYQLLSLFNRWGITINYTDDDDEVEINDDSFIVYDTNRSKGILHDLDQMYYLSQIFSIDYSIIKFYININFRLKVNNKSQTYKIRLDSVDKVINFNLLSFIFSLFLEKEEV